MISSGQFLKAVCNIFFICIMLSASNVKSQDLIIYNNSYDTIKCKIIKDKIKYLEYKLENDSNIYKIYQDQYDFYFQKNETVKKKELIIPDNNVSSNSDSIKSNLQNPYLPKKKTTKPIYPKASIGSGMGLDYGGVIGGRLTVLPIQNASFFLGFGYNLLNIGLNIGGILRIAPNQVVCPHIGGMYGYNSVIIVKGASNYNETYYGASLSFGLEFRTKKLKNYISIAVIIPFRSENFEKDLRLLRQNPNIIINNEPSEALFSIGYHKIIE